MQCVDHSALSSIVNIKKPLYEVVFSLTACFGRDIRDGDQNIYEDYQQKSDVPVKTCEGGNVCITPVDKGQRLAM